MIYVAFMFIVLIALCYMSYQFVKLYEDHRDLYDALMEQNYQFGKLIREDLPKLIKQEMKNKNV